MNHRNNLTGQWVNSPDHNNNDPARHSAPCADFKAILTDYANLNCRHCRGTGYLGKLKHVCAGRCFKCIPENGVKKAEGEFDQPCEAKSGCDEMAEIYLAVCGNDGAGPAYLSDGMWITPYGQIYDSAYCRGLSSEGLNSILRSACLIA